MEPSLSLGIRYRRGHFKFWRAHTPPSGTLPRALAVGWRDERDAVVIGAVQRWPQSHEFYGEKKKKKKSHQLHLHFSEQFHESLAEHASTCVVFLVRRLIFWRLTELEPVSALCLAGSEGRRLRRDNRLRGRRGQLRLERPGCQTIIQVAEPRNRVLFPPCYGQGSPTRGDAAQPVLRGTSSPFNPRSTARWNAEMAFSLSCCCR